MSRKTRDKRPPRTNLPQPASRQAVFATPSTSQTTSGMLLGYSFILASMTFFLYVPITHHPFINFDDEVYIYENRSIQSGLNFATLRWAFTSFHASNWHPLTWLFHAFNVQLFGLEPGGHHLASLLLHVGNAVLLFLGLNFAFRASGRCFFAATLFALHPQNVESVVWAAELKNLLCTLFFLTTVVAYVWYTRRPTVHRYVVVFLSFLLGLIAKPMVITLPFVLLLLDYWPLSRIQTLTESSGSNSVPQWSALHLVVEKLPLFCLSAASSWITLRAQTAGHATALIHPSFGLRLTNATVSYATYLLRMFVPTSLAPFYPFPLQGIPAWQILLSALLLVTLSTAVVLYGRQRRYLIVGWLWFLGTLVPVIGLLQVGAQSRADRYLYIPMIGLLFIFVWGFSELADKRKWTPFLRLAPPVLVLIILFAFSFHQIAYWQTNYSLWSHTIAVTGDNFVGEHNLSSELLRSGRYAEAYPHLVRAVALAPSDWVSHNDLGAYYLSQGKRQEAIREFKTVVENSTDHEVLLFATINMGSCYLLLRDFDNAEAAYRKALAISPNNPSALTGLNALSRSRSSTSLALPH